jgi:hypothetical protein
VATIPLDDGTVLELDNTWTALGKPLRERSFDTFTVPGEFRLSYRFMGTSVNAAVAGTGALESGTIGKSSLATVSVIHL